MYECDVLLMDYNQSSYQYVIEFKIKIDKRLYIFIYEIFTKVIDVSNILQKLRKKKDIQNQLK